MQEEEWSVYPYTYPGTSAISDLNGTEVIIESKVFSLEFSKLKTKRVCVDAVTLSKAAEKGDEEAIEYFRQQPMRCDLILPTAKEVSYLLSGCVVLTARVEPSASTKILIVFEEMAFLGI